MPELPEVEIVVRGLRKRLVGQRVLGVEVRNRKSFPATQTLIDTHLIGSTIKEVHRRQKLIVISLASGWTLVSHLKMTGQFVFEGKRAGFSGGHPEKSYELPLPHKHTHVIIRFQHETLYFNDLRKFGWIKLFSPEEWRIFIENQHFGPEPLTKEFTGQYLWEKIHERKVPIKTLLLDQHIAPGVGNIYADEALFEARVLPTRKGNLITRHESERLTQSIKAVLEKGIKFGGTTKNNYRTVDGSKGEMQHHLKVYGREGEKCTGCSGLIMRQKLGQRSTHFCPSCQK